MKRFHLSTFVSTLVGVLFLGIMLLLITFAYQAGASSAGNGGSEGGGILERLRGMRKPDLLQQALSKLEAQYFMEIDEAAKERLVYAAIGGMMMELRREPYNDDFSSFYSPELYDELNAQTTGNYAGIGILIGISADGMYPEIITVFPETPAREAGLEEGDVITMIDAEETVGMSLPVVATKIRGTPGSMVALTVFKPTEGELTEFEVLRRQVHYSSVSDVELLEGGVGYIKITTFAELTGVDFKAAMDDLGDQGMEALVIDLRSNSGGLVNAAVEVADCFISDGLILSVERRKAPTEVIYADPKTKKYDVPVLVMIDGSSASASEILAGALKDHALAKVFGEQSFGKGVVQEVVPMETKWVDMMGESGEAVGRHEVVKSALAITIGKYYTPSKHEIHGVGIEPDIWYNFENQLAYDPRLKELEEAVEAKREELRQLRTEARSYFRANDLTKERAVETALKLALGEEVPDVPQLLSPAEETALLLGQDSVDGGAQTDSGSDTAQPEGK